MKFSYTALNDQNQKMTGLLEAATLDAAKEELHKMGLSIIIISPISEEEYSKKVAEETKVKQEAGISAFIFNAKDPSGKIIDGTIDAEDLYTAYRRLVMEYHFKVIELYSPGASEADRATGRSRIQEFYRQLQAEGVDIEKVTAKKARELDEESEMVDAEIVKEIDQFIISSKKILQEQTQIYSNNFIQEIQKTLAELERIRTSNNLKHIGEVSNRLYELISNPDQLEAGTEPQRQAFHKVVDLMGKNVIVDKRRELGLKMKGLQGLQATFNRILTALKLNKKEKKSDMVGKASAVAGLSERFKKKTKTPPESDTKRSIGFMDIVKMYLKYSFTSNAVMKKARRKEFNDLVQAWKASRTNEAKAKEKATVKKPAEGTKKAGKETESKPQGKFYEFFLETDSFIGWLLFFYVFYFFLVDFSLEKGIGLERDFVIKTLKSPLILDITIFLVFAHLIFKIRNDFFKGSILSSIFLFFFGFGCYALVVINF